MTPFIAGIVVVAFVVGFVVVSWLMRLQQSGKPPKAGDPASAPRVSHADDEVKSDGSAANDAEARERFARRPSAFAWQDKERQYGRVLGLKGTITKDEVRKKYLEAIAKYHPDKVNHLAAEFQVMAEERTKALTEAYNYFRTKYNLR